jgi:hypothetical protein
VVPALLGVVHDRQEELATVGARKETQCLKKSWGRKILHTKEGSGTKFCFLGVEILGTIGARLLFCSQYIF